MGFINRDTDGTPWVFVRFTVDIPVIAETEEEALYQAELAIKDYELGTYAQVVHDENDSILGRDVEWCLNCGMPIYRNPDNEWIHFHKVGQIGRVVWTTTPDDHTRCHSYSRTDYATPISGKYN